MHALDLQLRGLRNAVPPAFRLLVAAVADTGPQALPTIAMEGTDWDVLCEDASRHGVVVAVAAALDSHPDAPAAARAVLRSAAHRQAIRSLAGLSELLRVFDALAARGIPAIALKGPVLSQWLYGDPCRRRFADLDVLVGPADRLVALETLRTLGYELPPGMSRRTADAVFGPLGAWRLSRGGSHPVDLHWRLAHARFPAPLASTAMFGQATALEIGGRLIPVPSATHAAVLTLLHAAKHLWCTLEMLVAIAALLRREDVDWADVRRLAKAAGAWQGCAAGLRLAAAIVAAPLPRALENEDWPAGTGSLCAGALAILTRPAGELYDRRTERRLHRATFDRRRDRLVYELSRAVAPTPLEWQWCPLPDSLSALYRPLRLVRLGVAAAATLRRPRLSTLSGTAAERSHAADAARPTIRGAPPSR
jgi:hypothetical protein